MAVATLQKFVSNKQRLVVLTGAGISTESGIPDYRSAGRPKYVPMQHSLFLESAEHRKRYWSRSMVGYPHLMNSRPNLGHLSLAKAEKEGLVQHVITQNVDGLHQMAGSKQVLELHGTIKSVSCMKCQTEFSRSFVQNCLQVLNPSLNLEQLLGKQLPDGDMGVEEADLKNFLIPDCSKCDGILKPSIVFFGDFVPRAVSAMSTELALNCDGLLVVGTSLEVNSAFRLVKCAARHPPFANQRPPAEILIVNDGPTRADMYPSIAKINGRAGELLSAVFGRVEVQQSETPQDNKKESLGWLP